MKITAKLMLNVAHHGWASMKIFHSRMPKDGLKQHLFYLFILLNNIKFVFYTRRRLQKRIEIKNYVKNHIKINYVEFRINAYKAHLCFYKNPTIETFTLTISKVAYFKKHHASDKV